MEGCDAMICGVDYHGGNDQSGCRASFSWSSAQPYQARTGNLEFEKLDAPRPEDTKAIDHAPFSCDRCRKPIVGLRFECIHCPATNFCEVCESLVEDSDLAVYGSGPPHEAETHILRIWREPEFRV
jgi:Zinc finger, ZZ type